MRKLTILLTLFVVAAIIWGGIWIVGASAMEKVMNGWLAERRAEGWVAEVASIETRGFPNRFDTTITEPRFSDPDTRVAWSAPMFQMLSLSYKPHHVIMVFPGEQRFATPDASYTIEADMMRGSMIASPSLSMETVSSTIEIAQATVTSSAGWTAKLDRAQQSMRERPDAAMAHTYDVFFSVLGLDPGEGFLGPLQGVGGLPQVIDSVTASAIVRFDKAWDLSAIEVARPQPRAVVLEDLAVRWGDLVLIGNGAFDVGTDGRPVGELFFEATNWREMVAIAEASGTIGPDEARRITGALSLMAGLGGDPDRLDVTLRFDRGITWLGPIPVGAAPDVRMP